MAVTLIGIPWDRSSSFQRGTALAPPRVRAALWSPSTNTAAANGVDIAMPGVVADAGDLALPEDEVEARAAIERGVDAVLDTGRMPLSIGGDHSISYPAIRAVARRHPGLTVLHLDAHSDLYDSFDGHRHSHACPFARLMEEGQVGRLVQVGIRSMTAHLRDQVARFGVEVYGPSQWREALPVIAAMAGPLYVSLDLDVLEPMLAPGLSHPEPGGLLVREVLELLAALDIPPVGADVVEYNPLNDVRDLTARVAARFVKELAAYRATPA